MQAIQCTTAAAPLFSSESRESGRGRWWWRRNRLPACGNRTRPRLVPLPAQPLVRSALRQGRGRELFPTPGYPLPAHNARAILPTALATARRLPTALATARRLASLKIMARGALYLKQRGERCVDPPAPRDSPALPRDTAARPHIGRPELETARRQTHSRSQSRIVPCHVVPMFAVTVRPGWLPSRPRRSHPAAALRTAHSCCSRRWQSPSCR